MRWIFLAITCVATVCLATACGGTSWPKVVEVDFQEEMDRWINLVDHRADWPGLDRWINEIVPPEELKKAREVRIKYWDEFWRYPNVYNIEARILFDEDSRYISVVGIAIFEIDEWVPGASIAGHIPNTLDGVPIQVVRNDNPPIFLCRRWCVPICTKSCSQRLHAFYRDYEHTYRHHPQNLRE